MNLRKFISGVSALTIAASAFAGMAVTASAVTNIDKSLFSQDFSDVTIDDLTINGNGGNFSPAVTVTDKGALNFSNTQARSVSSKYIFDDIVTASDIKNNTANLSFTVSITGNNYYSTGIGRTASTCLYVLPDGVSQTVSGNKSEGEPSEYLYGLQITPEGASDAKTMASTTVSLISGSEDVVLAERGAGNTAGTYGDYGITLNGSAAPSTSTITVTSTIDFDADTASIKINNRTAFTVNLKTDKTGIEGFMFRDGNKTYGGATLDNVVITTPTTMYDITKTETNATVTVDKTTAEAGETVTVTDLAAATGYVSPVISVKDANGNDVAVDANGQFTMPASDVTVTAEAALPGPVNSVKVRYQLSNGTEIFTEDVVKVLNSSDNGFIDVANLVVGDTATVPFRMYVEKDGKIYQTTANTNANGNYLQKNVTLTLDTVVTKTVTEVSLGGTLVLFEDLDDTAAQNAGIRASNGSGYDNKAYTSSTNLTPGVYKFILRTQNKGRASSVKVGDTTIWEASSVSSGSWGNREISNITVTEAAPVTLQRGSGRTYDDYDIIIAIKTAELPTHTDAEYDTTLTEVYNDTTGDGVWAKAYKFTVTPNDDTVTAVKVTDNNGKFVEKTDLSLTGTGAIVFGILAATKTENGLDSITFTPSITIAE